MTDKPDQVRLILTFAMALAGIVIVLIAFIIALQVYAPGKEGVDKPAESVAAVLGPITAVIGTLIGVAGQSAGAAGKEKAEERADTAHKQLGAVLGEAQPGILDQARCEQHPVRHRRRQQQK
jgi:hypothetical protein